MKDIFDYRFGILEKELELIDRGIGRTGDISIKLKNWAIVTWTGAIALFLHRSDLYLLVVFSGIPPIAFMFVDAHWRQVQKRFSYRQNKISAYLNSEAFTKAVETRTLDFQILDPFSREDVESEELLKYIAIGRVIKFPTINVIYLCMSAMSFILWFFICLARIFF